MTGTAPARHDETFDWAWNGQDLTCALTRQGTGPRALLLPALSSISTRDEMAPLYHVSTTALRYNPAGRTPEGEGMIWDTRDFPDGDWPTGFHNGQYGQGHFNALGNRLIAREVWTLLKTFQRSD